VSRKRRDPNAPIVITASTPYARRVEAFEQGLRAFLAVERPGVDAHLDLFYVVMRAGQQGIGLAGSDMEDVVRRVLTELRPEWVSKPAEA